MEPTWGPPGADRTQVGPMLAPWTLLSVNLYSIENLDQWLCHLALNSSSPSDAYMHQWCGSALVQVMACLLFDAKPLPEPMLVYCQSHSWEQISVKFDSEFLSFSFKKMHLKLSSAKMAAIFSRERWVDRLIHDGCILQINLSLQWKCSYFDSTAARQSEAIVATYWSKYLLIWTFHDNTDPGVYIQPQPYMSNLWELAQSQPQQMERWNNQKKIIGETIFIDNLAAGRWWEGIMCALLLARKCLMAFTCGETHEVWVVVFPGSHAYVWKLLWIKDTFVELLVVKYAYMWSWTSC